MSAENTANGSRDEKSPEQSLEKVKVGDKATEMSFSNGESFALLQRVARLLAESDLVPAIYKGSLPNCVIALNMAERLRADPLMVMQNLYIVKGKPGWSAKFLIATINQSGNFSKLRYEWTGEPNTPEWGCRAWAIERLTNERLDGPWITWKLAQAEGWVNKDGSKWKSMPLKMFMYRAGAWFVDVYAPELSMGLPTGEDLEDAPIIDLTPGAEGYGYQEEEQPAVKPNGADKPPTLAEQLKAKREAKAAPVEEEEKESATSTEEPKEDTKPADDGGMAQEDELRATLDSLIAKARKVNKVVAAKGKITAAFKLKSFDDLPTEKVSDAIDILTAFLEE